MAESPPKQTDTATRTDNSSTADKDKDNESMKDPTSLTLKRRSDSGPTSYMDIQVKREKIDTTPTPRDSTDSCEYMMIDGKLEALYDSEESQEVYEINESSEEELTMDTNTEKRLMAKFHEKAESSLNLMGTHWYVKKTKGGINRTALPKPPTDYVKTIWETELKRQQKRRDKKDKKGTKDKTSSLVKNRKGKQGNKTPLATAATRVTEQTTKIATRKVTPIKAPRNILETPVGTISAREVQPSTPSNLPTLQEDGKQWPTPQEASTMNNTKENNTNKEKIVIINEDLNEEKIMETSEEAKQQGIPNGEGIAIARLKTKQASITAFQGYTAEKRYIKCQGISYHKRRRSLQKYPHAIPMQRSIRTSPYTKWCHNYWKDQHARIRSRITYLQLSMGIHQKCVPSEKKCGREQWWCSGSSIFSYDMSERWQ